MAEADPQIVFNVHDAKTQLSKLIDRAHAGEEIVLAKAGIPYARLVAFVGPTLPQRRAGRFRHLLKDVPSDVWFVPEFSDAELDDFERHDPGTRAA